MHVSTSQQRIELHDRVWLPLLAIKLAQDYGLLGTVKVQKLVFLALVEGKLMQWYPFRKHAYGPYSPSLKMDLILLEMDNLIKVERGISAKGYYFRDFKLAEKGEEKLRSLKDEILEDWKKALKVLDKWAGKDRNEILSYVYEKYVIKDTKYDEIFKSVKPDLDSSYTLWLNICDCPYACDILAFLEYCKMVFKALQKVKDKVNKSVSLRTIEDLTSLTFSLYKECYPVIQGEGKCLLNEETFNKDFYSVIQGEKKCLFEEVFYKDFLEIEEYFLFLEDYVSRYNIFSKLEDLDFSVFFKDEEETRFCLQKLQEEFEKREL